MSYRFHIFGLISWGRLHWYFVWSLKSKVYYLLSEFLHFPVNLLQLFECIVSYFIDFWWQIWALTPVHSLCLLESACDIALDSRLCVLNFRQLPLKHASDLLEFGYLSTHLSLEEFDLFLALLKTFTLVANNWLLLDYFEHIVHSSLHCPQRVLHSAVLVFQIPLMIIVLKF